MRTAECVSKGHPDKICDQIADAILDEYLRQDPRSRTAIEVMGGHGKLFIMGEIFSSAKIDAVQIARRIYSEIGYMEDLDVRSFLEEQSPDIARGVENGGAGDQGIMIGYATSENEAMIPRELYLAREILGRLPAGFGPDAKCQATLNDDNTIETVVLSAQTQQTDLEPLRRVVTDYSPKQFYLNPTGAFTIGGFAADTGLTGRKLAVDNYGPQIPLGGGCFSGKDGSKVDRSAAYMARRIAVDYLRKYGAREVLVKLAYSIGVAKPVMAVAILDAKEEPVLGYDLTPRGIIERLDLLQPIYQKTAENGHFGHSFPWDD